MNDTLPDALARDLERLERFIDENVRRRLPVWHRSGAIDRGIFAEMADAGWLGWTLEDRRLQWSGALREALIQHRLARVSPGFAVALLIVSDLGLSALARYAAPSLLETVGPEAAAGDRLICLGNTENVAGSDAAGIAMTAHQVDGGWVLDGTKAYVTNGAISDDAVVTAVTDPEQPRNRRLSMFMVDLAANGVARRKLSKQVWLPADLTRLEFRSVFVPEDRLMGERGRGLQQVLSVFTHSRVPIAGLALGTADGAYDMAVRRSMERRLFGRRLASFQAKSFEIAEHHARIEAARLMLYNACAAMDRGGDFRLEAAMAKYLCVRAAQKVGRWAADLFGAASVIGEHPVFSFPMDAWAVSLAEGTQDVQKLVICRELLKRMGEHDVS